MDGPAFSQLRSTLKAASIRSLPAWKGMTDVLASTHYSNTYFKNYSVVHCQAWMKWYLLNFQMEYGDYMAIHFQVQFIWINCHRIPLTIMKSPLKFGSLSIYRYFKLFLTSRHRFELSKDDSISVFFAIHSTRIHFTETTQCICALFTTSSLRHVSANLHTIYANLMWSKSRDFKKKDLL